MAIGFFGSKAVVDSNVITGGEAEIVYGLRIGNQSSPLIINNVIVGDTATDISYGIMLNNSSPSILNNTIDGGSGGNESYGLFHFGVCAPKVENNIIYTTGGTERLRCLRVRLELHADFAPQQRYFRLSWTRSIATSRTGQVLTTIADVNALSDTVIGENVSLDPSFVSMNDRHLQASSPAEVREGGRDLTSEGYTLDQDGQPRTVPWSIGAFEQD